MKKTEEEEHAYLWDGSGEPDPEIVRLETLLGQLRQRGAPPELPIRKPTRSRTTWAIGALSAAAAVLLLAAIGWYAVAVLSRGWTVQPIAGTPIVDGVRSPSGSGASTARLRVGGRLETDAVSRARITVGEIGRVDVEPNTELQVVAAGGREHRMSLTRGLIHARIWAPPKLFFVNTPSATAIDLGCEYTLQVDEDGAGLIRVSLGWVSLEGSGRESFIPERAVGRTRPGAGPGTPYYADAPSGYGEALDVLDFKAADDPRRAASFDLVLSSARREDAFTLWHLLSRGTLAERERVYDRLAELVPPPAGVTRDAVLKKDQSALDQWWDTLGLDSTTWWRLWKRKL
ncbi:MAG TPA: FecR domain-containing protein [Vicinamibacterales bacterium]|nr:FecR domain-containing protein [Vicinamibacterales bacterium]